MADTIRQPDAERRINEHLEAVDRTLAAKGVPLTERRSVTGDVETQIRDMLAASAGDSATADDVEAVLRKLDAPESYAEGTRKAARIPRASAPSQTTPVSASPQQPAPARRRGTTVLVAAAIGGLAIGVAVGLALNMFRGTSQAPRSQAAAEYNLGWMYEHGHGVTKDESEAIKSYQKAADHGDAFALFRVGWMYEHGNGVTKDEAEAIKWYRQAAGQENLSAMFSLGWMYEHGRGTATDNAEAIKWYQAAADHGNAAAQKALTRLGGNPTR